MVTIKKFMLAAVVVAIFMPVTYVNAMNAGWASARDAAPLLHQAVRRKDLAAVQKWLATGRDPNVADAQGYTPLRYACENGFADIVRELYLAGGCDASLKWARYDSATLAALVLASRDFRSNIRVLSQKQPLLDLEQELVQKCTLLLSLAGLVKEYASGENDIHPMMVHGGSRFDKRALRSAVKYGDIAVTVWQLMMAEESNTDLSGGWTALHEAVMECKVKIAELLLATKADIEAKAGNDRTPLRIAVSKNNTNMVQLLLAAKADTEAIDGTRGTPLHVAAYGRKPKMVELLLKARANPDAKDRNGETPLDAAAMRDNERVEEMLDNAMRERHPSAAEDSE